MWCVTFCWTFLLKTSSTIALHDAISTEDKDDKEVGKTLLIMGRRDAKIPVDIFSSQLTRSEKVAHTSRNVTNLLPFSTPEGSRCRLIPVPQEKQPYNTSAYGARLYRKTLTILRLPA